MTFYNWWLLFAMVGVVIAIPLWTISERLRKLNKLLDELLDG